MIIVKLMGGLGNQMFQYAIGRVLSKLNKTELYLALSLYNHQHNTDTPRSYELDIFPNIDSKIPPNKILGKFTHLRKLKLLLNHYLNLNLQTYPQNWIRENDHKFHPGILKLRGNYLLDGYWQTEKYFKKYRKQIFKDFSFPKKISKKNKLIIEQIRKKNSVSIHVRRGDYVTSKKTNRYHGVCTIAYYKKAVSLINKLVKKPWFVVFSDDPNWCKKHLPVPKNSLFVSHNTKTNSFEDMRLMSLCKHNIIANSSFSWWGAWLNANKNKIIIAPQKWLKGANVNQSNIVPGNWKTIKV